MLNQSILLFHNGNSRVIENYRNRHTNLNFCGNWSEADDTPATGCLWEICFADATFKNLLLAHKQNIKIIRHISTYLDDIEYLLPECEQFEYDQWINHVVCNNLCVANEVHTDFTIQQATNNSTIILTTGRTANSHLHEVYKKNGMHAFETRKTLNKSFFDSADAVLLWRLNQWECLTSIWIGEKIAYQHQIENGPEIIFENSAPPIDTNWIGTFWMTLCKTTLDHSMFFKYVCNKPTSHTTTEFITAKFTSIQKPIRYQKQDLIPNYNEIHQYYENSQVAKNLTIAYNNVVRHLDPWTMPWMDK